MNLQIRITKQQATLPPTPRYTGWRCLHEAEDGYDSADGGLPEIRPSLPNVDPVEFTRKLQELSWAMNTYNPLFTKNNWRTVYGNPTAFCNGNGFGDPLDPRADWINMLDLKMPFPKLMKGLICGGMFIRGVNDDRFLYCIPGVHAIDPGNVPDVATVMRNNWYFVATTQYFGKVSNFPQGHGKPVYIPYVLRETASYPLSWFTRWESDTLPDPLKIYL